ncbi:MULTISPECIES: sigma-54-dependent transcriptional regulator [Roseateles]|uniref:Sigma-54 dependent transcriptional regulator n=1 Tax=Pelomonas caseinilytica TaxID=2906763 RepID=A0ABS8XAN2_9BURK|nr:MULTISPECIES: sigma-54 dependent transcriptional regulator [unclassified Roseateles]MCE4535908.1 sigma-54 dependent transcriptional regulator [Pelomonas sp. P7]HEV6968931.1 sigma-54 dependent transcriptional regulator [Roseateles sp.]
MARPESIEVLLVEDDEHVRLATTQSLKLAGLGAQGVDSAEAARAWLTPGFAGVVVCDVLLPGDSGLQLLQTLREQDPELPVILVTGHGDVGMAVEAMRDGAWDFIEKPFSAEHLVEVVRRALAQRRLVLENRRLKAQLGAGPADGLLGTSAAMEQVRTLIGTLGPARVDVLIHGETGSGKEVVARALHAASGARGPFVAINCGALPESVFESEIFGAEAGAYTGASKRRIGKLEFAGDGTVFLDEIESMPPALQVKMLRVLQERSVERLGANTPVPLGCRVVAATKVDLLALARQGRFREDLFYRLDVASIALPPLRQRREDIPLLLSRFCAQAAERLQRPVPGWTAAQLADWQSRDWPGNVRELRNFAERWVLGLVAEAPPSAPAVPAGTTLPAAPLDEALAAVERQWIVQALSESGGNVAKAGERLGLARKTLHDRIRRLGLDVEAYRSG